MDPTDARGLEADGDHLYVASWSDSLEIFDISSAAVPQLRGAAALQDGASRVAVTNQRAYVTVSQDGLQIVDVSDPTDPELVGTYGACEHFLDVAASGNYAFVAAFEGLRVLDVTTPSLPVEVGHYDPEEGVGSVDVAGDLAYVGCRDVSLIQGCDVPMTVLDISDPSNPVPVGYLDPLVAPGAPERIKVVGDLVFLAQGWGGVSIVRGCHALLVDGFESGNTSEWSATVP